MPMMLLLIELDRIVPGVNPYGDTRREEVQDILSALKSVEDLQRLPPLDVKPHEGNYVVLAGERRYTAISEFAEKQKINPVVSCRVHENLTAKEELAIAIAENEGHKHPTVIEMAHALHTAVNGGFSLKDACKLFIRPNGRTLHPNVGSTLLAIHEACSLAPIFQTEVLKQELGARAIYDLTIQCKEKAKGDSGRYQELLEETAEALAEAAKAAKAAASSASSKENGEGGEDQKKDPPAKKLLPTKKVIRILDEAQDLYRQAMAEAPDQWSKEQTDNFTKALKLLRQLLDGKIKPDQLLKKLLA